MRLHHEGGAELILFQDEFFVSGRDRVMRLREALVKSGLHINWKAFGLVNLIDEDMMRAMAETGCVEIRFGIESGSDRVLQLTRKGFCAEQAVDVVDGERVQEDVTGGDAPALDQGLGIGLKIAVGDHRSLGSPGGPGRVENGRKIASVALGRLTIVAHARRCQH